MAPQIKIQAPLGWRVKSKLWVYCASGSFPRRPMLLFMPLPMLQHASTHPPTPTASQLLAI